MTQKQITTLWNRENRLNMNSNFTELYEGVDNISGKITDEIYEEIKDGVKLEWTEHVDSLNDLPSNPIQGTTVMISGQGSDYGKVFRYSGSEWVEIQKLNPDAIIAMETRLQSEIDDRETPQGSQAKADIAEGNAIAEVEGLRSNIYDDESEVVKLVESGSNANGHYMRWSDGRQECWGMEISQNANTSDGIVYRSSSERVDYPKSFSNDYPVFVNARVLSINRWANATGTNVSYASVTQYSSKASGSSSFTTELHAVGRWK